MAGGVLQLLRGFLLVVEELPEKESQDREKRVPKTGEKSSPDSPRVPNPCPQAESLSLLIVWLKVFPTEKVFQAASISHL